MAPVFRFPETVDEVSARLVAAGVIPAEVCEACNDIRLRHEPTA